MPSATRNRALGRQARKPPQPGIALVIVLWALALLSAIAGSLTLVTRTEALAASNLYHLAQAEALADAGLHKALFEMTRRSTGAPEERWRADGQRRLWRFQGTVLAITIADESGKIDLNHASRPLLTSLFASAGASAPAALADAVIDWRDPDNMRSRQGAEKEDYLSAGRRSGPANAPFATIEELRLVLGVTDDLYRRIAPAITVHSQQPGLNAAAAKREALLAIPGATPDIVESYLARRQASLAQGQPPPPFPIAYDFQGTAVDDTFSVLVEAALNDKVRIIRETVVRLEGRGKPFPAILTWRSLSKGEHALPETAVSSDDHRQSR